MTFSTDDTRQYGFPKNRESYVHRHLFIEISRFSRLVDRIVTLGCHGRPLTAPTVIKSRSLESGTSPSTRQKTLSVAFPSHIVHFTL